jgi:hypothetical protein
MGGEEGRSVVSSHSSRVKECDETHSKFGRRSREKFHPSMCLLTHDSLTFFQQNQLCRPTPPHICICLRIAKRAVQLCRRHVIILA